MPLYIVLAEKDRDDLDTAITTQFPDDSMKVAPGQWLVSADMIPNQVGDKLNVRTGAFGRVLVLEITGAAAGWHASTVWPWLRLKTAKAG